MSAGIPMLSKSAPANWPVGVNARRQEQVIDLTHFFDLVSFRQKHRPTPLR